MKSWTLTVIAVAALAGCGGGGGADEGGDNVVTPVLELGGVGAGGLAFPQAAVQVKCAAGTAETTTNDDGTYSVSIENGELPCMIQLTVGTGEDAYRLHSVAATATATDGATTSARANVTPLTEMVVAQMLGELPASKFDAFNATGLTAQNIDAAKETIITALQTATTGTDVEVNFANLPDPFTGSFQAKTATNTASDPLDDMLDKLAVKVPPQSVAQVVQQIVESTGTEGAVETIMSTAAQGHLANCPSALSGKYRTIDYWGRSFVRQIDFGTGAFNAGDGTPLFTITPDTDQPCQYMAGGIVNGQESQIDVAVGTSGAGTYRGQNLTTGGSVIGYVFPVQKHTLAAIAGEWTFIQSGYFPDDGTRHYTGKMNINSTGAVTFCDYQTQSDGSWICDPDDSVEQIQEGPDHGFRIVSSEETEPAASLYAYRAPNGTLTLFGTTNPTGASGVDVEQTNFVAIKSAEQTLPTVGLVTRYWDALQQRVVVNGTPVNQTMLGYDANEITAVDVAAGTFSRERVSDGRPDTFRINHPVSGVRYRGQTTWNDNGVVRNIPGLYSIGFPGLRMGVAWSDGTGGHFYNVNVMRPARTGE